MKLIVVVAIAVSLMFTSCGGPVEQFDAGQLRPYAGEPLCPCADVGAVDGAAVCRDVESCTGSTCRTFCAWVGCGS